GVADLPFQAAQGFLAGLALGWLLREVGAAVAVPVADLGDRGHVDGVVEPSVAAPVQPPDLAAAAGHLDRGGAVVGGEVVPAGGTGPRAGRRRARLPRSPGQPRTARSGWSRPRAPPWRASSWSRGSGYRCRAGPRWAPRRAPRGRPAPPPPARRVA